jgi:nitrogen regulatory protein PII
MPENCGVVPGCLIGPSIGFRGDGKIYIYGVEEAVRIGMGERGDGGVK